MNKQTDSEEATKKASAPNHPLKEGAPYDKRELRERIAEGKEILEKELLRLQATTPMPTSTPQIDTIAASLAALKTLLPADGAVISEVSAAELSRWLEETPFVADKATRHARRERE